MPASWTVRRRRSASILCAAAALLLAASSCTTSQRYSPSPRLPVDAPAVNAHYSTNSEQTADRPDGSDLDGPPPPRIIQLDHEEELPAASEDSSPDLDPPPPVKIESPVDGESPAESEPPVKTEPPDKLESWIEDESPVRAELPVEPQLPAAAESNWQKPAPVEPTEPAVAPVVQTSVPDHGVEEVTTFPGSFLPTDPRVTLPIETVNSGNCPLPWREPKAIAAPVTEPEIYPEEYICDGGDRGVRVYYDDFGRRGLETEDTVAEFTDHGGERHIRPSTRTCIYAPQFAAVRSMSLPQVNLAVDKLAGTHDHRPSVGLRSRLTPGVELQTDQPIGLDLRTRASGMDGKRMNGAVARVQSPARHIKLNNVFENELFLSGIELDRTQEAYLAHAVQVATDWTRDLNPVIVAADAGGEELIATFHVEEYVGLEEPRKGELKIIKVVDEPAAVPGDVITFSIHYENIGERELYHIRIIDNLTPRLELLPESWESDREGQFIIEDNNEGSVILTFELAEPLPGKSAGTLTFQCRVR